MPNTFGKRAKGVLHAGDDSFKPRGEKNRALFEEMKKEMQKELAGDVAKGKKSVQDAGSRAVQRIKGAADAERQKIKEYTQTAAVEAVNEEVKKRRLMTPSAALAAASVEPPAPPRSEDTVPAAPEGLQTVAGHAVTPSSAPSMAASRM